MTLILSHLGAVALGAWAMWAYSRREVRKREAAAEPAEIPIDPLARRRLAEEPI